MFIPFSHRPFCFFFRLGKRRLRIIPALRDKFIYEVTRTPSVDFVDTSLEEGGFKSGVPIAPSEREAYGGFLLRKTWGRACGAKRRTLSKTGQANRGRP